jgi:hypothetical protein
VCQAQRPAGIALTTSATATASLIRLGILSFDPNLPGQPDDGSVQITTTDDERLTRSLVYGLDNVLAARRVELHGETAVADGIDQGLGWGIHLGARRHHL